MRNISFLRFLFPAKLSSYLPALFWIFVISISFPFKTFPAEKIFQSQKLSQPRRLLFLPLDERFTTRDLFLSFAKITPFQIITPEKSRLSDKKISPDVKALIDWTEQEAGKADAAVISADMLLYGGLIASRTSLDSLAQVRERLNVLKKIRLKNPQLPLYVSSTVMRMPSYSSAEEEPDYYAKYGRQIFLFSESTHRYEVLKDSKDKTAAENYKNQIPKEILDDYLIRRARNFAINKDLIELVRENVINRLVITLDDNAEYGLFKKEAAELLRLSANLSDKIAIYPGADEAQLPLLARFVLGEKRLKVFVAYRYPESKKLIPAFEGQPLEESVKRQINAAGGIVTDRQAAANCVLYVNNFKEKQIFPPKDSAALPENAESLEILLTRAGIKPIGEKVLITADINYYNGADTQFVAGIFASKINPEQIAYAGWNTSGNTLGSAIALGFLRHEMKNAAISSKRQYKKLLWTRFMEDWVYMVEGREELRNDLKRRNLTGFEKDKNLEKEYAQQIKELFDSRGAVVNKFLKTDFCAEKVFFPWHRSFEIGFEISN